MPAARDSNPQTPGGPMNGLGPTLHAPPSAAPAPAVIRGVGFLNNKNDGPLIGLCVKGRRSHPSPLFRCCGVMWSDGRACGGSTSCRESPSHLSRHAEVAHLTGTKASASGVVSTLPLPVHASFMRVRVCQPEGYCQSLTGEPIVVYPAHRVYFNMVRQGTHELQTGNTPQSWGPRAEATSTAAHGLLIRTTKPSRW